MSRVHHIQEFFVPVEALFAACVRGDLLRQCAGGKLRKSGDFIEGERYDCVIKEGTDFIRGRFLEIVPNRRIVFTWETLAEGENTGVTTITLTFEPSGAGSRLVFDQENIASSAAVADQFEGWEWNLKTLAAALK